MLLDVIYMKDKQSRAFDLWIYTQRYTFLRNLLQTNLLIEAKYQMFRLE
jgi:hypothetical protein